MTTLGAIESWAAAHRAGRELLVEDGLLRQVREGEGVSRYTWSAGELAQIEEPDGSRWRYEYGVDGRLLSTLRNGRPWADYSYDSEGRLVAVTRPGYGTVHSYDERGRLLRTLRGDASPFTYRWEQGPLTSAASDREQSHFRYSAQGRLTGIEQSVDGVKLSADFIFDAQERLTRIAFREWAQNIEFEWDERGRPAGVRWNQQHVALFGSDDRERLFWMESIDGVREETWHEAGSGRAIAKTLSRDGAEFWRSELVRDEAFRLVREGVRTYRYDALGRLAECRDPHVVWTYSQDEMDRPQVDARAGTRMEHDARGRMRLVRRGAAEWVYRHNDADELREVLLDGVRIARFVYDHKGRLVLKEGRAVERYVYGPDDGLLAVADGNGRPRRIFLRLPTGIVGMIDFDSGSSPRIVCLHFDTQQNLIYTSNGKGDLDGPFASDPYGVPLQPHDFYLYRGRLWHPELALYRFGCRWYDPELRQYLTPDTYTGAPDDERLVNPFVRASEQRVMRMHVLGEWLREPRLRNRFAYCNNDPVNRFDPNGHWSFGGVLLSVLGVLWTLPNTVFGLAIEVTCLLGEIVRWLVYLFSGGSVTWQTPGFDAAASGRLNAFALVFKGGWMGSMDSNLLGVTFGNVIFINADYETHPAWVALPDPVFPPAYNGTVSIPKSQALYEHELRHTNQYGWWGPFFHLGLPIFGVYEWDCILNGYQNASLEKDARDHGGF